MVAKPSEINQFPISIILQYTCKILKFRFMHYLYWGSTIIPDCSRRTATLISECILKWCLVCADTEMTIEDFALHKTNDGLQPPSHSFTIQYINTK